MPINVVKVTKTGQQQVTFEPWYSNRLISRSNVNKFETRFTKNCINPIHLPPNSVYLVSEVNNKINEVKNAIDQSEEEFKSELSKSLEDIQKQIISLKKQIIKDQAFIENITDSLTNNETFLDKIKEKLQS
ncbi:hypothetical protein [Tenacibaculum jejuense]|uniref:Uncharacterized protein n=1 Tax=Tenacibaculum jejuense TaxID=584609 RepID=A0A238UDK1_9FLAO|nr:hypothetical protein [Tenacibaculum jejuense]SNR16658.1 protein of unknown function [Tenacibaculum jejuense]